MWQDGERERASNPPGCCVRMSVPGQKQTCQAQDGMSASPLKADVRAAASMSAKGHKPTLAKMPSRVANGGDQNVREDVAIAS